MTTSIPVDPSNAGQLQAWEGNQGQYWTSNADLFDLCVVSYDGRLLDAATIRPGDHVLDRVFEQADGRSIPFPGRHLTSP